MQMTLSFVNKISKRNNRGKLNRRNFRIKNYKNNNIKNIYILHRNTKIWRSKNTGMATDKSRSNSNTYSVVNSLLGSFRALETVTSSCLIYGEQYRFRWSLQ